MLESKSLTTVVPALETRGISKDFGAVKAVQSVDFSISVGEVVGLVGENGAGKSTLLSLMSGSLEPDGGELLLFGEPTRLRGYHEGTKRGVFRIFQHQALVPNLTVAQNIYLAQEKSFSKFGVLNDKKMICRTQSIFDELGVEKIRPSDLLMNYNFAERQVVEIVRSIAQADLLGIQHPVILLDEPTGALSREQIDFFFSFVKRIRHRAAQVFVSHRLLEVLEICDRLFVMKDGKGVADVAEPSRVTENDLHQLMVGRSVESEFDVNDRPPPDQDSSPALSIKALTGHGFQDLSFDLHQGEILGVAGVIGAGKSDLARAIFESGKGTLGRIELNGELMRHGGPREAIRKGIGYVPPERHAEGIIGVLSVAKNLSLPAVGSAGRNPVINVGRENDEAEAAIQLLSIKTPSPDTSIGSLSGGNQQKVVLARWTTLKSRILVLDNPTNGVDVGAKVEIYRIIRRLTAEGVSVLLMSDDLQELIGLSDRILVMKDGRIASEIPIDAGNRPSEVEVVAHMV